MNASPAAVTAASVFSAQAASAAAAHAAPTDVQPTQALLTPTPIPTPICRALFLPFIEQAEQFAAACQGNNPHWALNILLPALLQDMRTRFAHEEQLLAMVPNEDSFAQAHVAQHHEMLQHLLAMYQQGQHVPGTAVAAQAGRYVQHQLLFHVGSADCELARRLMAPPPGDA